MGGVIQLAHSLLSSLWVECIIVMGFGHIGLNCEVMVLALAEQEEVLALAEQEVAEVVVG